MSIKPILFNTEMIQAILDGRKTQTCRIVKGLEDIHPYRAEPAEDAYETLGEWDFMFGGTLPNGGFYDACQAIKAPYAVGDVLWVRETWCSYHMPDGSVFYTYKASAPNGNRRPTSPEYDAPYDIQPWHPSIHMPKEAARIFLKVTNIRAERLQDMDEEDAIAEGFPDFPAGTDSPLQRFSELWDKAIKREFLRQFGYHANPWVWVIEFEHCENLNTVKNRMIGGQIHGD